MFESVLVVFFYVIQVNTKLPHSANYSVKAIMSVCLLICPSSENEGNVFLWLPINYPDDYTWNYYSNGEII